MDRVTLAEAATRLGVSEQTIRRRLKTGELQGEREVTAQGYRWWVSVPESVKGQDRPNVPTSTGVDAERIQRLEADNAWLKERVVQLEAASTKLVDLLANVSTNPELVRLLASPVSPSDQSNNPPTQSPTQGPTRRRWLKRWKP